MLAVFLVILLIAVIVFGCSSSAQSYATAQQAQATIEVAQVAQINAWGNVMTIVMVGLIVLLTLAVLAAIILWMLWRRSLLSAQTSPREGTRSPTPMLGKEEMGVLLQMKILQMLDSMTPRQQLSAPRDEEPTEEPFSWLRLK